MALPQEIVAKAQSVDHIITIPSSRNPGYSGVGSTGVPEGLEGGRVGGSPSCPAMTKTAPDTQARQFVKTGFTPHIPPRSAMAPNATDDVMSDSGVIVNLIIFIKH